MWGTGLQALVAVGGEVGAEPEAEPVARGSWWEVIYGNTVEGAGRAVELGVALQAFAEAVEVDGANGDGQLAKQLGDLGAKGVGDWGWSG